MNKWIAEFIGTFCLVFTIGCTVVGGPVAGVIPPLAIAAALIVMIYASGHISGAHFNPAVTVAVWIRGRCDTKDVLPYMLSQVAGAVLVALTVKFLRADANIVVGLIKPVPALLAEFLFTFALVYVILNVATAKATAGNSYYGLAIGFTVMAGAFAVGAISGAAFNPAVAIGVAVMGLSAWGNIWIYLVACFSGGAAAAVVFKLMNPKDV